MDSEFLGRNPRQQRFRTNPWNHDLAGGNRGRNIDRRKLEPRLAAADQFQVDLRRQLRVQKSAMLDAVDRSTPKRRHNSSSE